MARCVLGLGYEYELGCEKKLTQTVLGELRTDCDLLTTSSNLSFELIYGTVVHVQRSIVEQKNCLM